MTDAQNTWTTPKLHLLNVSLDTAETRVRAATG